MDTSYTLTDAARSSGRSRVTMRRYLDAGRFPNATRDESGAWRIPAVDLVAAGLAPINDTPSDATEPSVAQLRTELAVARALADERSRTIDLLAAQLAQLQDTLRATIAR